MFERFTENARAVLVRAGTLARDEKSPAIRRHHMLIGLLEDAERRSDGVPALILADADTDLAGLRERLFESLRGSETATATAGGKQPFSSGAKKALELALREALSLGHNYIGCEHLLLSILRSADGPLEATLGGSNLKYGTTREYLRNYRPAGGGRRRRFGRGPGGRHTRAVEDVLERAQRRALSERAVNTGDLLVALAEGEGTHFATLTAGASLPDASTLGAEANKLVEAKAPDGALDAVRLDPKSGAVTIKDPALAAAFMKAFESGAFKADDADH
ncbi:MAG: hypothetical protein H0U92_02300 [Actinobacteria bacterium]|nr:hypothetical protein [Actinomycetota bacterium]